MAQAIIEALKAAATQATTERSAAEERERQALLQVEVAKTAAADAATRRATLVETLEQATVSEETAMALLGPCRLSHADAEREVERLADAAAQGSDPAARALSKAHDQIETIGQIVQAHERRVRALRLKRETAEAALAEHDQAEAKRLAEQVEARVTDAADIVYRHLAAAVEAATELGRLIEIRQSLAATLPRHRVDWTPPLAVASKLYEALRGAFYRSGAVINPASSALGTDFTPGKSMASAAADLIFAWGQQVGGPVDTPAVHSIAPPPAPAAARRPVAAPRPAAVDPDLALPGDPGEAVPPDDMDDAA